jgi:hypothetical protein
MEGKSIFSISSIIQLEAQLFLNKGKILATIFLSFPQGFSLKISIKA